MNRWLAMAVPLMLLSPAALLAAPSGKPDVHQHFGAGARVDELEPDGAAAGAGIRPGDLIVAINGKPVNGFADIEPVVAASGKHPLLVDLDRSGSHMRVKVVPRVVSESTAQGIVERKTLGISHTDYVPDPHPPRAQNLVNLLFPPDEPVRSAKASPGEADSRQPERPPPRNLMELLFPPE